ncbi:MAG: hypothetical protein ACXWID_00265 [Pyrinomonadaceae bacterium]
MAEGDKFEQRLRGFGWRKVYKLGKSDAEMANVVDATVSAVSRGLRKELACARLAEILGLLQFSLQTDWQRRQADNVDRNEQSPQSCLGVELERIEAGELGSITAQLASTVAQSLFADMSRRGNYPTREAIRNAFADELVWRIVDNRCLSHVREGIALGAEHTATQHERWERDFRRMLRPQAEKLVKQMLKDDGSQAIARAPRRLTPKLKTKDVLHKPLHAVVR